MNETWALLAIISVDIAGAFAVGWRLARLFARSAGANTVSAPSSETSQKEK